MKLDWLILADAAEAVNGKLYLLGGGWDTIFVNSLPAKQMIAIAVGIEVKWTETNERHTVELHIEDQDGNQLVKVEGGFEVGRPPGTAPGQAQRVQLVVPTPMQFQALGTYVVKVLLPDEATHELAEKNRTSFRVVSNPAHNIRQSGHGASQD